MPSRRSADARTPRGASSSALRSPLSLHRCTRDVPPPRRRRRPRVGTRRAVPGQARRGRGRGASAVRAHACASCLAPALAHELTGVPLTDAVGHGVLDPGDRRSLPLLLEPVRREDAAVSLPVCPHPSPCADRSWSAGSRSSSRQSACTKDGASSPVSSPRRH